MKKAHLLVLTAVMMGLVGMLASCTDEDQTKPTKSKQVTITPFQTTNEAFNRVVGWLTDSSVLLQVKRDGQTEFFSYDIYSGKQKLLYQTSDMISDVSISADYAYFLVYAASSKDDASIKIFKTATGEKIAERQTPPVTMNFYWNQDTPEKLMLVAYDQDWQYRTYVWNFLTGQDEEIQTLSPFVAWYSDNLYLMRFHSNEKSELSDLYLEDIRDAQNQSLVIANILQFGVNDNLLVTLEKSEDEKELVYDFRTVGFQTMFKYTQPREYDDMGTFIPYFDTNFDQDHFLVFEPYESQKLGETPGQYRLVEVDPKAGTSQTIMELMENQPLESSPNGKLALYGYQFDKVIDTKTKQLITLVDLPKSAY
ncbi:hypothetical protein [Listeria costaricensis]|uniref:YqgU-like beta propeller domain-containing protein n=1 Tax=Listeria costaricensis TaxID=2026604 RepID=UPI000C088678|nr:hypothetical protein [Listeria costaricensis]